MSDTRPKKSHSHFLENDKRRTWRIEDVFEKFLWSSRFLVLFGVISSLAAALCLFFIGTFDVVRVMVNLAGYALGISEKIDLHVEVIGSVIGSLDIFLVAVVLLLFSLGLYQLFLRPLDAPELNRSTNILSIETLDGLKDKLVPLILLALMVKFFQIVLIMKVGSWLDLLILAGAVGLLALALLLVNLGKKITHDLE